MNLTLALILFFSLFLSGAPGRSQSCNIFQEREANFHRRALIVEDEAFLRKLQGAPTATYFELRKMASAKGDFPFAPHLPIMKRILADIQGRLDRRFGDKYRVPLMRARMEAQQLIQSGDPPYRRTIRFIVTQYWPLLDMIMLERHPKLRGMQFYQGKSRLLISQMLKLAPTVFLYFSAARADERFFVDTRTSLMSLVRLSFAGLDDTSKPPYADGHFMTTSEFGFHNLSRAELAFATDLKHLKEARTSLDRLVWEWEATRVRIREAIERLRATDPELAAAEDALLFEILHEHGSQFSLTFLKQELETEKWTVVLQRKLAGGVIKRMEEARRNLLQTVENYREQDQLLWVKSVKAEIVPSTITYTPPLTFQTGELIAVEISRLKTLVVIAPSQGSVPFTTEIREMVTAQIDPLKNSPLTDAVVEIIQQLLGFPQVDRVIIHSDQRITAVMSDRREFLLSDLAIPGVHRVGRRISRREVYEIDQILGAHARGEPQTYTMRRPSTQYSGTISIDGDMVQIKTQSGKEVRLPLAELRIDPF